MNLDRNPLHHRRNVVEDDFYSNSKSIYSFFLKSYCVYWNQDIGRLCCCCCCCCWYCCWCCPPPVPIVCCLFADIKPVRLWYCPCPIVVGRPKKTRSSFANCCWTGALRIVALLFAVIVDFTAVLPERAVDVPSFCCSMPIGTISTGDCWINVVISWKSVSVVGCWTAPVVVGTSVVAGTVSNSIVWPIPGRTREGK